MVLPSPENENVLSFVGLAFLLLSIYDFAVFFRFLVRKGKDDNKATTRKVQICT